jgi:hypothetical protein
VSGKVVDGQRRQTVVPRRRMWTNTYIFSTFFFIDVLMLSSSVFDANGLIGRKFDDNEVHANVKHYLYQGWKAVHSRGVPRQAKRICTSLFYSIPVSQTDWYSLVAGGDFLYGTP